MAELRQVDAEEVIDLRHRILRAGLPRETAVFEGDDLPTTLHFGAHVHGEMVCCLTLLLNSWENEPAWQLRGMATDERRRKGGMGRSLVGYAVSEVRKRFPQINIFWCNARVTAIGFYEKLGWRVVSEPFDEPGVGPHVKMVYRPLATE